MSENHNMLNSIEILSEATKGKMPPTEIYNEGWMLRLVLDWFSNNREIATGHELSFSNDSRWYSEPLLPTQFKARPFKEIGKKDDLAESHTHADGVIGDFDISGEVQQSKKGELVLRTGASQFVVTEAKMGSKLSKGVSHAPEYNQAARNVACMAEVFSRAKEKGIDNALENIELGFYVIAPREQLERDERKFERDELKKEPTFRKFVSKKDIQETVNARVEQYGGSKDKWREESFTPFLEKFDEDENDIKLLSWETIIDYIKGNDKIEGKDKEYGEALDDFYKKCKEFNK